MFSEKNQKYFFLAFEVVTISLFILFNLQLTSEASYQNKNKVLAYQTENYEQRATFGDFLPKVKKKLTGSVLGSTVEFKTTVHKTVSVPSKKTYLIAVVGDSMVETMGDSLEYLGQSLKRRYPGTNFVFYNYGVGGENVEQGLTRFDKEFLHLSRHYGPLSDLGADIIIIGSFSYNPFSPYDRDRHWTTLSDLVRSAKATGAKVYILAEIAPLEKGFGVGPGGVNWPSELADIQAQHIMEQLENAIGLASSLGVGLFDVYDASRVPGSKFGKSEYVATHDGIHPSVSGEILTAEKIASTISLP